MRIDVLNGPNLDRLGNREPEIYGRDTLDGILARMEAEVEGLDVQLAPFQSNHEGALVDAVHAAADAGSRGFIVNAAAYTHTSVALRDALVATGLPFVEVHLSNVHAREPFRHRSLLADVALGVVGGFGGMSYVLGLRGLLEHMK